MTKRVISIGIWSVAFFVGSATLTWVTWRLYFALTGAPDRRPSEDTLYWFGLSAVIVPLAFGLLVQAWGFAAFCRPPAEKQRKDGTALKTLLLRRRAALPWMTKLRISGLGIAGH